MKTSQQIDHLLPSDVDVSATKEELSLSTQMQAASISEDSKSPIKSAVFGTNNNEKELQISDYNFDSDYDDTASHFLEHSTSNGGNFHYSSCSLLTCY